MGLQTPITHSFQLPDGRLVSIETGKLATQADGSVVVKVGNTMLFCSVVSSKEVKEGQSFFPLSVDYQEKYASMGRIPGNFFKREARLSDYEILISRLVDRVVRPLFPDGYMNETQIIINLISGDAEELPDAYVALAASAALSVSDIPFTEPISEVRVARINGEFVINPSRSALKHADLDIILGATIDNIMMVEGEADECSELDLIEAIKIGHEAIKVQCVAQKELAEKVGEKALIKRAVTPIPENEEVAAFVKSVIADEITQIAKSALDKKARKAALDVVKTKLSETVKEQKDEEWISANKSFVSYYFDKYKKSLIRDVVLQHGIRLDGRANNQVRPIWTEVEYLPSTHGSSIFNRGETQSLTSVTLGTKLDEMMFDTAHETIFEKFILHYNFPALSVGEIKPMRGPGRREVGHANLAGRSIKKVMPQGYPYTVRLVSDILESNGSSSMATVCAGSLALMDAGVPIKSAISGIAMGLIAQGDKAVVLTDILGDEDALGDMDFKVTGTYKGICGCQMDIKVDGLSYELLEKALLQAREGRIHILDEMAKTISKPNEDLKSHAPRMEQIKFEKEFIGAVIGPGGKIIQAIQAESGAVITIEEVDKFGIATISSSNAESLKKAIAAIKSIIYVPSIGDVFEDSTVVSIKDFGVFVDFLPGKSGLVHISEISHARLEKIEDSGLNVGDKMKVKIVGVDAKTGKFKLSRKVLLEKPVL